MKYKIPSTDIGVIIVDMQPHFLKNIDDYKKCNILKNQLDMIEFCDEYKIPIFVLEYYLEDIYRNKKNKKYWINTVDKLTARIDRLDYQQYLIKDYDDGFIGSIYDKYNYKSNSLESLLDEYFIKNIVFMGVNASACVYDTATSAAEKNYNVITSLDIIADPWDDNFTLKEMYEESPVFGKFYKKHEDLIYDIIVNIKNTKKWFFIKIKSKT